MNSCPAQVPKVGELVGGSVREDRFDVLHDKMTKAGMCIASIASLLCNEHCRIGQVV